MGKGEFLACHTTLTPIHMIVRHTTTGEDMKFNIPYYLKLDHVFLSGKPIVFVIMMFCFSISFAQSRFDNSVNDSKVLAFIPSQDERTENRLITDMIHQWADHYENLAGNPEPFKSDSDAIRASRSLGSVDVSCIR